MNDLEVMELFDEELLSNNISWSGKDIDTIDDDDFGNSMIFYVYYEDPKVKCNLDKIKNIFNEKQYDYIITELKLVNDELRAKFKKKDYIEEQILYY